MKYTCTVEVLRSVSDCIDLWFDESKFKDWQDGFQSKTWTFGEPNQINSKSNILINQNGRKIELEETIIENELPQYILGTYDHVDMNNTQKISFNTLSESTTLIKSEVEYTAFHSFMPKVMAKLFPSMFKKQSQKWLDQFKILAERNQ